jgi:tetrahydromethanopterin S-methyltransferase subunit E
MVVAYLWLTNGTILGSVFGGFYFGLSFSSREFISCWFVKMSNEIAELRRDVVDFVLTTLMIIVAIILSNWKIYNLMPSNWNRPMYYDLVCMITCIAVILFITVFEENLKPKSSNYDKANS